MRVDEVLISGSLKIKEWNEPFHFTFQSQFTKSCHNEKLRKKVVFLHDHSE